jgi:hypothetical protein
VFDGVALRPASLRRDEVQALLLAPPELPSGIKLGVWWARVYKLSWDRPAEQQMIATCIAELLTTGDVRVTSAALRFAAIEWRSVAGEEVLSLLGDESWLSEEASRLDLAWPVVQFRMFGDKAAAMPIAKRFLLRADRRPEALLRILPHVIEAEEAWVWAHGAELMHAAPPSQHRELAETLSYYVLASDNKAARLARLKDLAIDADARMGIEERLQREGLLDDLRDKL